MLRICCTLAVAFVAVPAAAGAQTPPPPPATSLFTTEQAARGAAVYQKVCVECHESLEYTGPDFRVKWNGRTAFDLYDLIKRTMPDESPNSLPAQDYADVVGYMMRLNGVPPGKTELPTDVAALKKLVIAIPGGAAREGGR